MIILDVMMHKTEKSGARPAALLIKDVTRRLFLKIAGGIIFMAGVSSSVYAFFIDRLPERTVEKGTFKFNTDTGRLEWEDGKKEEYKLVVDGLVKSAKSFSYEDLKSLPQVDQISDFHCVEGWSVKDIRWGGFRFKEIISRVEPEPRATHIAFHSFGKTGSAPKGQGHYIESFPISELLDPEREIIFALRMNNNPLPEEHGAPLRLISPYDLAYKSIKFISRIEFIRGKQPGWWTLANPIYSIEARVPASRLRKRD
jgi:DMSO/TMAO reductase YedYZ molybdopterin-dependent catalytic subunit